MEKNRHSNPALVLLSAVLALPLLIAFAGPPRTIEVIADRDNKFKLPGQKGAVITLKAGEVVRFKVTSRKGTEWDKDGAVHSFTVKQLKDQGWDVRLKEGVQEFVLVAPTEPGEYLVECLVNCGKGHDDMRLKLVVTQ
jgi:heme/copper-type cytochrome/quinol oxidase subunit 2